MTRVTASDLEEMRARGYDPLTIEAARETYERGRVADQLITRILDAFNAVTLGNGVGLREAQGLDEYADEETCAAYRKSDEKEDWTRISVDELNQCNSSLSFFDPEGMRFHLPAFMIAELRGDYNFGMAFSLTQGDYTRYFSALHPTQRLIVREFLLFLQDDPNYQFDRVHIEKALQEYWTHAIPQSK